MVIGAVEQHVSPTQRLFWTNLAARFAITGCATDSLRMPLGSCATC